MSEPDADPGIRVDDRRHWARKDSDGDPAEPEAAPPAPPAVDAERRRAELAESRLLEYIDAFKQAQLEQERFRERMTRDVERRVELRFGELVVELLGCLDDLDLALAHAAAEGDDPLLRGMHLVRGRFVAALERCGVERIDPTGTPFDPHSAEALNVVPVDDPARDQEVVDTLRPGYKLGERILRPARVTVGRHAG
jgi:molecular chaperone GrpE